MKVKKSYLVIIFNLFALCAIGQSEYLITLKGDTLYGKIFISSLKSIGDITVKTEKENVVVSANMVDRLIIKDVLYKPVNYANTKRMAQIFEEGYLSHIGIRQEGSGLYNHQLLYKETGEHLIVSNLGFKKRLSNFLQECAPLIANLETGVIKANQIQDMVRFYNNSCSQSTINTSKLDIVTFVELINRVNATREAGKAISAEDLSELLLFSKSDLNALLLKFLDTLEQE